MDYKFKGILGIVYLYFCILFFLGCSSNDDKSTNTFYIELVNFTDSLKTYVSNNTFGKVAFYKNNRIEVLSRNYMTEKYDLMHYLNGIEAIGNKIEPGTQKIRVEFIGAYSVDSIKYSLQKYRYLNNKWIKVSDMGVLKAETTYKKAKEFSIPEFGNQIIITTVEYTFN